MKSLSIAKLSALFLVPVLLTPTFAFGLATGNSSGGGGISVGDTLLDLYEDPSDLKDLKQFKPEELPAYQTVVAPALSELAAKVPFLAREIRSALTEKKWYFTNRPLARSNDECLIFKTTTDQVGRQEKERVVILDAWFNKDGTTKHLMNQGALILHEMVMHSYLKLNPSGCSANIREMVRLILNSKTKSAEEIQSAAADLGFGRYAVFAVLERLRLEVEPIAREFCEVPQPSPFGIEEIRYVNSVNGKLLNALGSLKDSSERDDLIKASFVMPAYNYLSLWQTKVEAKDMRKNICTLLRTWVEKASQVN